ncbi:MAG TPA: dTDP-4-dehydrorhamnose reductase [Terriglobia bacterium]|nr:dTDP-4-dehydrorhamnose reductase [Terriglobia bacterium]
MKIALLGSNGQLGQDLRNALQTHDVRALTRADFDVTEHDRARSRITDIAPDVIINTTAFHRVDDCESQPELAYAVNALAALNLVRVANDLDATIIHFSTDYVFDGSSDRPYDESSPPMPLSVYGNSKLAGEYLIRTLARKPIVIRTCGLYGAAGSRGKGGNFVEAMLEKARRGDRIAVVDDQTVTPTYTADLALQVAALVESGGAGLYHATNDGQCTWYTFARAIFEIAGIPADLNPTTSAQYRAPARRPRYSVLENARLKVQGLDRMRPWRDALADYLDRRRNRQAP